VDEVGEMLAGVEVSAVALPTLLINSLVGAAPVLFVPQQVDLALEVVGLPHLLEELEVAQRGVLD
jgi:hypothetical protein